MELYNQFLTLLISYQHQFNKTIASLIRNSHDGDIFINTSIILGIAFLYGLIHAAGPGHGKALVAAYFSTNKNSYKKAFQVAYLISIIHAFSALIITFGIYFFIGTMFRQNFMHYSEISLQISAIIIIVIGFYLIGHAYLHRHHKEKTSFIGKNRLTLAFTIGIVPCPGVMTIVLFCIALKEYLLGIFAAISMSIGMGLTIAVVSILSVFFNKKTDNFINSKGYILEMLGGMLILLLGFLLLQINT